MDFTKYIYAEIEGDSDSCKLRDYLISHEIKFDEELSSYKFVDNYYVFRCIMTKEQMFEANRETGALFYQ